MSVDMEISKSGSSSSEGEEDEEELNRLLNSLNGIEKCFLPNDSEDNTKNVHVPKSNGENEITVNDNTFSEDVNIRNLDGNFVDCIPLPQERIDGEILTLDDDVIIEHTLSSGSQKSSQENSDSDVIVEKVCETRSTAENRNTEEVPLGESINVADDGIKSRIIENNQISSSDSDIDIIEHIEGSSYLEKGFIDLTVDDDNVKEEMLENKSTEKDDTEAILEQINKIKKALMKHKKKKKRRKRRSDERKMLSRTRSRSRSKSKSLASSDDDKINKKLCLTTVPKSYIRENRRSRSRSERSDYSHRLERHRHSSRRSRSRDRYCDRKTPRSYRTRSRSPRTPPRYRKRSISPATSVKRRKECNSPESIRQELRKENELAVKSLMSVNSVHQQTVISDGKQMLTARRTSTIIQEILTSADNTQPFAVNGQTNTYTRPPINQQNDLDNLTRDMIASSNLQQNYSANADTLRSSNADYPYRPVEETDKCVNEKTPENHSLQYEEFIL